MGQKDHDLLQIKDEIVNAFRPIVGDRPYGSTGCSANGATECSHNGAIW